MRKSWLDAAGLSDPNRDLGCDTNTGALRHGDVPKAFARGQDQARRAHRARERAADHAREQTDTRSTTGTAVWDDFVDAYRIPDPMARLVRLRDGSCRFPGCSVPARQCDLDHVRPWPIGPTSPSNLMALCRRHHRIKQRDGWTSRLHRDGTATWTDPTGLQRTTWPVDHLHLVTATTTRPTPDRAATRGLVDDLLAFPSNFEEALIEFLGGPNNALRGRSRRVTYAFDGTLLNGDDPPRIDLDTTTLGRDLVVAFPPRPPRPPDPIPF